MGDTNLYGLISQGPEISCRREGGSRFTAPPLFYTTYQKLIEKLLRYKHAGLMAKVVCRYGHDTDAYTFFWRDHMNLGLP